MRGGGEIEREGRGSIKIFFSLFFHLVTKVLYIHCFFLSLNYRITIYSSWLKQVPIEFHSACQ